MPAPAIPIRDVKIIYTVCPAIAIFVTAVRLWLKARSARLWWDDGLAFMSAVFIGLSSVGGWMHFEAEHLNSQTSKVAAYYLIAQSFYGTLWCARLSILYSIVRIASNPAMKRFLHCLAGAMVVAWIVLFSQIWWVCVPMPNWTSLPAPQCPLTLQVAILQLVSDILADLMLIAVPIRLFINSQLEKGAKTRLVAIFSASVLTTIVSLVHAYFILKVGGADVLIAATVEIAVSLIVCNLSIVVSAIARACGSNKNNNSSREDDSMPVSRLTFASRRSPSKHSHGEVTTIGLTEITVQKESTTYVDMTPERGQGGVDKSPVVYFETKANGQKAYFPGNEHWS